MLDLKRIGKNIRKRRIQRKMTQAKLGKLLGVSQQEISAWEHATRGLREYELPGIARALGISTDDLLWW